MTGLQAVEQWLGSVLLLVAAWFGVKLAARLFREWRYRRAIRYWSKRP